MKRLPKAYSRAKRKEQVLRQFAVWRGNGDTEPKTMYRIARALGMSPAQTFTDILAEMVLEGSLIYEVRDRKGRWTTRFFQVNQAFEHYHEKYGKRRIVIKHRGVISGQMELPF
jgi:hypothetical protein